MNQADWLACNDPARMLGWLTRDKTIGHPSDRKLRLFVHACVLCAAPLGHPRNTHDSWLEKGLADPSHRDTGAEQAVIWTRNVPTELRRLRADLLRSIINPFAPPLPPEVRTPLVIELAEAAYEKRQGKRECVGCAGKRVVADERHRTGPLVVKRCPACHGEGTIDDGTLDPERLAVLSDALEEAGLPQTVECWGCQGKGEVFRGLDQGGIRGRDGIWRSGYERCASCDETGRIPHPLLASLRSPGPHYRGLWSLDQCLGRE